MGTALELVSVATEIKGVAGEYLATRADLNREQRDMLQSIILSDAGNPATAARIVASWNRTGLSY